MAIDTSGNFVDDDAFWDTGAASATPSDPNDPTAGIIAAYQQKLGRPPDARELASEVENYGKYGADQLNVNLDERARSNGGGGGGGSSSAPVSAASGAPAVPNLAPFSFNPADLGKSEGFKFRYDKAIDAIKKAGAAKGTYFNPQTWKAAESEASGLAAQELDAEFNRQGQTWDRNTGAQQWTFGANRQNRLDDFDIYNTNRNFDRGVLESDREFDFRNRGFDYQKQRDTVDDNWRYIDYGFNSARNPS